MKRKKILYFLVFALILFTASEAMCGRYAPRFYGPPVHHYYRPSHFSHHYHGYYGGDALAWGLAGLVVGSAIALAAVPQRAPAQIVYTTPVYTAPPVDTRYRGVVYSYPPQVPPGMCRWERYRLDNFGRYVIAPDGQPVKEWTLGSCQYSPAN
jgi:hypothetical protein